MSNEITTHTDSNKCYLQVIVDGSIFELAHPG